MRHLFGEPRAARSAAGDGNGPADPSRRAALGTLAGAAVAGPSALAQSAGSVLTQTVTPAAVAYAGKMAAMVASLGNRKYAGFDIKDIIGNVVQITDDEGNFEARDTFDVFKESLLDAGGTINPSVISRIKNCWPEGDMSKFGSLTIEDLSDPNLVETAFNAMDMRPPTPDMLKVVREKMLSLGGIGSSTPLADLEKMVHKKQAAILDAIMARPELLPTDPTKRRSVLKSLDAMRNSECSANSVDKIEKIVDDEDVNGFKKAYPKKSPEDVRLEEVAMQKTREEYRQYIFTSVHTLRTGSETYQNQPVSRFDILYANHREKEKAGSGLTRQNLIWLRDRLQGEGVSGSLIEVEDTENGVIVKTTDPSLIERFEWLEQNNKPLKIPRGRESSQE